MSNMSPELRHTESVDFRVDDSDRRKFIFYRDDFIFLESQGTKEIDISTVNANYPELTPLVESGWKTLGFYFGVTAYRPADVVALEHLGIFSDEMKSLLHADMGAESLLEVTRPLRNDEMPMILGAITDEGLRHQIESKETKVTGLSAWATHMGLRLHVMTANDLTNVGFTEPYNLDLRSSISDLDESYLSNTEWEAIVRTYYHLRKDSDELLR